MRVAADNLWAVLVAATNDERRWLVDYLTVPVKNAEHSDAFQAGAWDGTVKLFDQKRQRLASGLLRLVAGRARESGVEFVVEDVRVKPPGAVAASWGAWLRPYQREAVEAMLRRGRGIVSMPTGSGKTSVFAALTQAIPIRWLVLVDQKDLLRQAASQILKWTGELAGIAGDGEWNPRRVTVATLQTLLQGLGRGGSVDALLGRTEGMISDECQVVAADEFGKVAMATPNAYYRYGLSATPLEREDEADYMAIGALGPLIYEVSAKTLIDMGHLAKPEIYMVEFDHERMSGTYAEVYEAGVVLNQKRNELVAMLARSPQHCPRPTLVFFKAIPHGRQLSVRIPGCEVISGRNNTWSRDHARVRLNTGQTDVLLTSRIFNQGVDIPFVESAVNAAGGASTVDAVQKIGRIMRVVGEKKVVRYWDVYDRRNQMLERHARARLEAFKARGYSVSVISQADVAVAGQRGAA